MYGNVVSCPLKCPQEDTQYHLLECQPLQKEIITNDLSQGKVLYEDIFGDTIKQKEAVVLFTRLIDARAKVLKERESNPPGDQLDPSMGSSLCCVNALFTSTRCINCMYIGK